MKTSSSALRDGVVSGSLASVLSTAVLAASSVAENGTPYAPTNATSHWLWGRTALHQDGPSARYTLLGYVTHHASAIFWAAIYEKVFGKKAEQGKITPALGGAAAVSGLAYLVDYKLMPQRLQPGYEERLSSRALFLVYGALGLAFALRGLTSAGRRH